MESRFLTSDRFHSIFQLLEIESLDSDNLFARSDERCEERAGRGAVIHSDFLSRDRGLKEPVKDGESFFNFRKVAHSRHIHMSALVEDCEDDSTIANHNKIVHVLHTYSLVFQKLSLTPSEREIDFLANKRKPKLYVADCWEGGWGER